MIEMISAQAPSIEELVRTIKPPSELWREKALARLDTLTKPVGSLGRLEEVAAQIVAIQCERASDPLRKGVYIFAADHGVTAEGVSAYPREVTQQMVMNFVTGGAAINVLTRLNGADLSIIDVGVDAYFDDVPGLFDCKIAMGSRNMLHEPAMSEKQLSQALAVGAYFAEKAAAAGQNVIAVGEMGIGNTTSASALTCALTGAPAHLVTGRGTGILLARQAHKTLIIEAALAKQFGVTPVNASPLEVLRCLGGLEIAAMVGMVLGAARRRLLIVMDGFISSAAAAVAVAIEPNALGYLVAGHRSEEPGHAILLDHLGLAPLISLGMRLGEGTGAVLALPILESALALYNEMATFASAGVSGAPA